MKKQLFILLLMILSACSSADLVNSWKNPEVDVYSPNKVLIVGITSNSEARKTFENKLQKEFAVRNIDAIVGYEYLGEELITEADLQKLEKKLVEDGFDTILFTRVVGSDSKTRIAQSYKDIEGTYRDFKDEYYTYQNIIKTPEYYENYPVYHAETLMYCICDTAEKKLIWKGYVDITDPISINDTVSDYVNLLVLALDEFELLN